MSIAQLTIQITRQPELLGQTVVLTAAPSPSCSGTATRTPRGSRRDTHGPRPAAPRAGGAGCSGAGIAAFDANDLYALKRFFHDFRVRSITSW